MIIYEHYPFQTEALPYTYNALEPYIDTLTMELHHDRHMQTYINNLNELLEEHPGLQALSLEQLIITAQKLPLNVGRPISRNAGGIYNHALFFDGMRPYDPDNAPRGELLTAIQYTYGNYETFQRRFKAAALSVFGSGYAWLVSDRNAHLNMIVTMSQETPLPTDLCPLLNLDVWEHAYYLKHYNNRSDYIDDWFHVVDWDKISDRFLNCPYWS